MFLISNLPKVTTSKKKRIGRGGNRGKNSGMGNKGQKKRAGKMRVGFEGGGRSFIRRTPKVKGYGFLNKGDRELKVLNLNLIESAYENEETLNLATLKEKKLIDEKVKKVRIINSGTLTKKIKIEENENIYLTKGVKALLAK